MTLPNAMIKAVPLSRPTELLAAIDSAATAIYVADDAVGRDKNGNIIAPIRLVFGIGPGAEEVYCPTAPVDRHYEGVTRGVGGTTARAWPKGTPVARRLSATDWDGVVGNIDDLDGRVETLEGASPVVALDDLSDVDFTDAGRGDLVTGGAAAWTNLHPGTAGKVLTSAGPGADLVWGDAPGGTTTSRLAPITKVVTIATTDAATGKADSVDLTANHGLISRIRIRADWVSGQQSGPGTFQVNNAAGISASAIAIAIDTASAGLTLADGDEVQIDGERILCGSGTSTSGVANATRGYAGTVATYHDDNVMGVKLADGLRLELYPSASRVPSECLLSLSKIPTAKWVTDAAIAAGDHVLTLTTRPTLVSAVGEGNLILIDDTTDEVARIQDVYGDVAAAASDDSITVYEALAAHAISKDVYLLYDFDLPTPFKFASGTTLYLTLIPEEKFTSTITATLDLVVDKFA